MKNLSSCLLKIRSVSKCASMTTPEKIHLVNVFTCDGGGGNLAPIVLDARGLSDADMREVARRYGRESAFVFPTGTAAKDTMAKGDHKRQIIRFFVPEHEMEMCGHATVGTAWVMHHLGEEPKQDEIDFTTLSGPVRTRWFEDDSTTGGEKKVFVSQPAGRVDEISDEHLIAEMLSILNIDRSQLAANTPIQNAATSRVKTVIPLKDVDTLNNGLHPDFSRVKGICEKLGSTGLYPYAVINKRHDKSNSSAVEVEARQFPKASGYPEDAATGIAAATLTYALAANGVVSRAGGGGGGGGGGSDQEVVVYQGRAMGYLSQITVKLEQDQCWVGGTCALVSEDVSA